MPPNSQLGRGQSVVRETAIPLVDRCRRPKFLRADFYRAGGRVRALWIARPRPLMARQVIVAQALILSEKDGQLTFCGPHCIFMVGGVDRMKCQYMPRLPDMGKLSYYMQDCTTSARQGDMNDHDESSSHDAMFSGGPARSRPCRSCGGVRARGQTASSATATKE